MSTQEKVVVKFVKHWRGYNAGEVAGFDPELAQRLQDGGVAEKHGGGTKATKARGDKTPPASPVAPPAGPDQGGGSSDPDDERP